MNKHDFIHQMVQWLCWQTALALEHGYIFWRKKCHWSDQETRDSNKERNRTIDYNNDPNEIPPPMAPYMLNPLKLGRNISVKLTRTPQLQCCNLEHITQKHSTVTLKMLFLVFSKISASRNLQTNWTSLLRSLMSGHACNLERHWFGISLPPNRDTKLFSLHLPL